MTGKVGDFPGDQIVPNFTIWTTFCLSQFFTDWAIFCQFSCFLHNYNFPYRLKIFPLGYFSGKKLPFGLLLHEQIFKIGQKFALWATL
jgi:hypothetical protein